jgi:hypothetical protein
MQQRFQPSCIRALTGVAALALWSVSTLWTPAASEELTTKSDAKDKAIQIGITKIGSVELDRDHWIVIGRRKNNYVALKLSAVDGEILAEDRLLETPEYDSDDIDLVTKCNPNIGIACAKK